jgi:hypothetical protein
MKASGFQISEPPREISAVLAAQMYLGGVGTQIGWLIFGFGSIFFWFFAWHADFSGWRFREGTVSRVTGEILNCRDTHYSVDESEIYAGEYHYSVGGASIGGVSYGTDCAAGETTVEYLTTKPEFSRVAGMTRDLLGPWASLVALFPGIGLGMIIAGVRKGVLRVKLLRDGVAAPGHVKSKVATASETNGRTDYRVTVAFTARDGSARSVAIRTNRPENLADPAACTVLHDPTDPNRALPMAGMPGKVSADGAGSFVGGRGRTFLVLPLLSTALNVWFLWNNWEL